MHLLPVKLNDTIIIVIYIVVRVVALCCPGSGALIPIGIIVPVVADGSDWKKKEKRKNSCQ